MGLEQSTVRIWSLAALFLLPPFPNAASDRWNTTDTRQLQPRALANKQPYSQSYMFT